MKAKNNNSNSSACQSQIKHHQVQRKVGREARGPASGMGLALHPRSPPGRGLARGLGDCCVLCAEAGVPQLPGATPFLAAPALPDLPCKDSS